MPPSQGGEASSILVSRSKMQTVIFHGAFGSKNGNWFPWLKLELEAHGQKVFLEQYPVDDYDEITSKGSDNTTSIQNLDSWTKMFEKTTLPKIKKGEPLMFVGHSLAPVFIIHLVEKYELTLDCAIFVSPFLESLKGDAWQFDIVNRTFYKTDFNWEKMKKLIPVSYVLYGVNDPYVPNSYPLDFASKMGSSIIPVKNGGHLGGDFKELPLVLELCRSRI